VEEAPAASAAAWVRARAVVMTLQALTCEIIGGQAIIQLSSADAAHDLPRPWWACRKDPITCTSPSGVTQCETVVNSMQQQLHVSNNHVSVRKPLQDGRFQVAFDPVFDPRSEPAHRHRHQVMRVIISLTLLVKHSCCASKRKLPQDDTHGSQPFAYVTTARGARGLTCHMA
jgi:hypothetical protein